MYTAKCRQTPLKLTCIASAKPSTESVSTLYTSANQRRNPTVGISMSLFLMPTTRNVWIAGLKSGGMTNQPKSRLRCMTCQDKPILYDIAVLIHLMGGHNM